MHIAAANGHKDIVGFFLDQEYITDSVDVGGGITIASYQTVNVDSANTSGCTPLHYASRYGELEVVKFLVGKRANIYAGRSTDGCKALHLAALNGHKNVVEFFLNQGMSVSDSGKDGWTPLHYAAQGGCLEVVKFLTRKGASINVRDADGTKPVHSAALWGQKNVVEFFLDQGMSINTTGEIGFTLLHFAAQGNRTEITRFLLERGADANIKNECGEKPIDVARRKGHSNIEGLLSSYTHPDCIILSTDSNRKQQEKFLCSISNADVRQVEQGLYLPSFEARNVKINGKCTAITRGLSQALSSRSGKSFVSNLETSAKIYERIAQGKQVSKREEREVFAFSNLLNNFERQLDSATNSLPSNLIHTQGYKTFSGLSNYIAGVEGDFAIHLVTNNHVVAIYRIGDNYAYFDSNAAFVSGLKSVDQLIGVVEKGVKSAGYKVEEKGFLVEHFDVDKANNLLSDEDRQVLTKEIKTERQLLAEQDKELGPLRSMVDRVQLYDFGTKINVEGGVPLLINAGMNLSSKKFQDHLDKKEMSMTAREYLDNLKNSKNVEEVVQATKEIPFEGSKREIKEVEQTRKPKQFLLEQSVKGAVNFIANKLTADFFASVSQPEPEKTPETHLNDLTVDKQQKRSQGY